MKIKKDRREKSQSGLTINAKTAPLFRTKIHKMDNKKQLFTGIIFYPAASQKRPRKYRNINNVSNFLKFALKTGGWYVNLYDKETRLYCGRKYLTEALEV